MQLHKSMYAFMRTLWHRWSGGPWQTPPSRLWWRQILRALWTIGTYPVSRSYLVWLKRTIPSIPSILTELALSSPRLAKTQTFEFMTNKQNLSPKSCAGPIGTTQGTTIESSPSNSSMTTCSSPGVGTRSFTFGIFDLEKVSNTCMEPICQGNLSTSRMEKY